MGNDTLTLITATGGRPDAWALCQHWMARQDYAGPVTWVIIDDGPQPQPVTFKREGWQLVVIRPAPLWKPGQNTQARNLLKGLDTAGPDARVVIIEDDDWYSPNWLSLAAAGLEQAELVGEPQARYYNVATQAWQQMHNTGHASLCSTALRGSALQRLEQVCRTAPTFIDLKLWRSFHGSKLMLQSRAVVGIKGLPGREGIGCGHAAAFGRPDPDGAMLRGWIGADAGHYQ